MLMQHRIPDAVSFLYFPWIAIWLSRFGYKFPGAAITSSMSIQHLIHDAVLLLYFLGWPYSSPNLARNSTSRPYLVWCQCNTWSATQCHFCIFLGLPIGFPDVATNSKSGPFLLRCQCNTWSTTHWPDTSYACWAFVLPTCTVHCFRCCFVCCCH